jgi:hypothetical protein
MDTSGKPTNLPCIKRGRRNETVSICLAVLSVPDCNRPNVYIGVLAGTWRWRMPSSWAGVPFIMQPSGMLSAVEQSAVCLHSYSLDQE